MTSTLHPDGQRALELIRLSGRPPFEAMSPQEARAVYRDGRNVLQPEPAAVALVRNLAAPGPADPIPLRLYRATGTEPHAPLPTRRARLAPTRTKVDRVLAGSRGATPSTASRPRS